MSAVLLFYKVRTGLAVCAVTTLYSFYMEQSRLSYLDNQLLQPSCLLRHMCRQRHATAGLLVSCSCFGRAVYMCVMTRKYMFYYNQLSFNHRRIWLCSPGYGTARYGTTPARYGMVQNVILRMKKRYLSICLGSCIKFANLVFPNSFTDLKAG